MPITSTTSSTTRVNYLADSHLPWTWRGQRLHAMRRVELAKLAKALGVENAGTAHRHVLHRSIHDRLHALKVGSGAIEDALSIAEPQDATETTGGPPPQGDEAAAGPPPSSTQNPSPDQESTLSSGPVVWTCTNPACRAEHVREQPGCVECGAPLEGVRWGPVLDSMTKHSDDYRDLADDGAPD